jgi:PKD domain
MRRPAENPARLPGPVPDAVARFAFTPLAPSVFDTVRLFDYSYDPGRVGIATRLWRFGDGTTTDAAAPSHRYAEDGDYVVTLEVTTADGRVATAEQRVGVSTHDVSVMAVDAPEVAAVGETHTIVVRVASPRRPETVQVELLRSSGSRRQQIGVLTRAVDGPEAEFSFEYTFTEDDAAQGPLTFEALATIVGARDALPGDNVASVAPTIVR